MAQLYAMKVSRLLLPLAAILAVPEAQAQNPFRNLFPFQRQQERPMPQRGRESGGRSASRPRPAASSSSQATSSESASQRVAPGGVITRPTVITAAGRYVLGSNVTGSVEATTAAIVIVADNVTLDLGGHTIRSRASSSPDNCGVAILGDHARVRNGAIAGFAGENQCGVLVSAGVRDFAVEDVRLSDCETGILINPENDTARPVQTGRIARCAVTSGSIGILAFPSSGLLLDSSSVSGCVPRRELEGEGSGAVLRGSAFTLRDCTFTSNTDGLRLEADSSSVFGTVTSGNLRAGCMIAGSGVLVRDSNFSGNGTDGLVVAEGPVRMESSLAARNGGNGVALHAPREGESAPAGGNVFFQNAFTGNGAVGLLCQVGGNLVDSCTAAGNGGGVMTLQPTDVYRNCVLPAAPAGGRDAGGNLVSPAGR